jgi:hypothetical protein
MPARNLLPTQTIGNELGSKVYVKFLDSVVKIAEGK